MPFTWPGGQAFRPTRTRWQIQRALVDFLETDWDKPDEGIWEVRGPRRQFTHSKVMALGGGGSRHQKKECRGVRVARRGGPMAISSAPGSTQTSARKGSTRTWNAFVQYYGSKDPDASLLMLPLVGFLPATDPRMRGHCRLHRTAAPPGRVRRPLRGRSPRGRVARGGGGRSCFVLSGSPTTSPCRRRYAEAKGIFERLLDLRNDVGLLSEQHAIPPRAACWATSLRPSRMSA